MLQNMKTMISPKTLNPATDDSSTSLLKTKIDALNDEAWSLHVNDSEHALSLSNQAHLLSISSPFQAQPYEKGVAYSLAAMAITHHIAHSDYQRGIEFGLQALSIAKEIKDDLALNRAYYALGVIHGEIGNILKSIEYALLRLDLCEKMNDTRGMALAKMSLGVLYADIEQFNRSQETLHQSLTLFQDLNDNEGIVRALNNISFTYMCTSDFAESITTALAALENPASTDLPASRVLLLTKLASGYCALNELEKAESYLNQARDEISEQPDKYLHIRLHQRFGNLHMQKGAWDKAVNHFQLALTFSIESGQKQMQYECHEMLGKCYKAHNRFEAALEQYELFYHLKDEIFNEQTQQQIHALEVEHRTETAVKEAAIFRSQNIELEKLVDKRTKALAEQSIQLKQLLEREQHLAKEVKTAYARETEVNQLRAKIIEVVSHEFRTPLAIINTSCDLLRNHYARMTEEKRTVIYKRIKDSIFNLTDLLKEVTFINQAEKTPITPNYQSFSFHELCRRQELNLQPLVEDRPNILFSYSNDSTIVSADPELLHQILTNLIANAIQYSEKSTTIQITMTRKSSLMKFEVADHGIGVPESDLQSIFKLFERGSNVGQRQGLGLGLSIVERIATALNGHLTARSKGNNQGAVFQVSIPCNLSS